MRRPTGPPFSTTRDAQRIWLAHLIPLLLKQNVSRDFAQSKKSIPRFSCSAVGIGPFASNFLSHVRIIKHWSFKTTNRLHFTALQCKISLWLAFVVLHLNAKLKLSIVTATRVYPVTNKYDPFSAVISTFFHGCYFFYQGGSNENGRQQKGGGSGGYVQR